jgi:hypothetical protein
MAEAPSFLPVPEPVVYRREGKRRLEPEELQALAAAAREGPHEGLAFLGPLVLTLVVTAGLIAAGYGAFPQLPAWFRATLLVGAVLIFHAVFHAAPKRAAQGHLLRIDLQREEVLRFVADGNRNGKPRSLELLENTQRVWRRDGRETFPAHASWPLPSAVNLEEVFEIGERYLDAEELALLPYRTRKEVLKWLGFSSVFLLLVVASSSLATSTDREIAGGGRTGLICLFLFPNMLSLTERMSLDRLRAVRAVGRDAADGVVWLLHARNSQSLMGPLAPVITTEVLPRSGLVWRGPYQRTRATSVRQGTPEGT